MKIIYCIHSICNPGGMERVLLNKVTYLSEKMGWDITVVTTDQHHRPPFYPFPETVKLVDLDINYSEDNGKNILCKIAGYLARRRKHKKALTKLLMREKADLVVSLFPSESSFIPDIRDGSKKVLELHFNKFFRLEYNRSGMLGRIDRWRTRQDERLVRRFDRFVVLTEEDRGYWGSLDNIEVIPNAALGFGDVHADVTAHRVIAVGRLDYQKGFDRLLKAWEILHRQDRLGDWHLDIFGQGEWKEWLESLTDEYGIRKSVCIHRPTKDIAGEYRKSSFLVMTSHYEGLPMVMIEAMACGLPVVTFDYKCGPRDIIREGVNGCMVPEGDTEQLARTMYDLMQDEERRRSMSANAMKVTDIYAEKVVMDRWISLFRSLTDK